MRVECKMIKVHDKEKKKTAIVFYRWSLSYGPVAFATALLLPHGRETLIVLTTTGFDLTANESSRRSQIIHF